VVEGSTRTSGGIVTITEAEAREILSMAQAIEQAEEYQCVVGATMELVIRIKAEFPSLNDVLIESEEDYLRITKMRRECYTPPEVAE
jgi:hypothetical protein